MNARAVAGLFVITVRGIGNPIGVKCGPSLEPDVLLRLLDTLNPARIPGRMTLITRYGHDKIEAGLPKLVRAVKRVAGLRLVTPAWRQERARRRALAPVTNRSHKNHE